jgi:DNA-binding response OmpR family regulator
MRLLLVEDEIKLAQALKVILENEGYQTQTVYNGKQGYELALKKKFDLLLLDLNLPQMDGVAICTHLRQQGRDTPVIMITARDTTTDRVLGLDAGADDYLVKPFETQELLARIRALLRRQVKAVTVIEVADLTIDSQT